MKKLFIWIDKQIMKVWPKLGTKLLVNDLHPSASRGLKFADYLYKNKAILCYYKDGQYAWIEVNGLRYYFHKTEWYKPKEEKIKTMNGSEKVKVSIGYDGWETDG